MAGGPFHPKNGDFPPLNLPKNSFQPLMVGSNTVNLPITQNPLFTITQNSAPPPPKQDPNAKSNATDSGSESGLNSVQAPPSSKGCSNISKAFSGELETRPIHKINGHPCVSFKVTDKLHLLSQIKYTVVAKFSHGRPSFLDFQSFLSSLRLKGGYRISEFDIKHVFVELDTFEDFVQIWLLKSRWIKGFRVRFFQWGGDFNPVVESYIAPIWIHLPALPMFLFQEEAIISIASLFGKLLYIDPANLEKRRVGYLSFCVAKDVRTPGILGFWIEFVGEGMLVERFWQKVLYADVPPYCSACFHLGHLGTECKKQLTGLQNPEKTNSSCKLSVSGSQKEHDPVVRIVDSPKESSYPMFAETPAKQFVEVTASGLHELTQGKNGNVAEKQSITADVSDGSHHGSKAENAATELDAISACKHLGHNAESCKNGVTIENRNRPVPVTAASSETSPQENTSPTDPIGDRPGVLMQQEIINKSKNESTAHTTMNLHKENVAQLSDAQSPPSWHDSVQQNIPIDFSILVEEIKDSMREGENQSTTLSTNFENSEEDESSEEGDFQSSDEELSLAQKMEKFEKVSKDLLSIKKTRIIYKKYALGDKERWCYSEEEEAESNPVDLNMDPLMGKDGEVARFSKLTESRTKLVYQRSVSPVGRSSTKLKYLKTKTGYLELEKKSAILMSTEKYERTQLIKDTRQVQSTSEEWITPKRRGRPPKRQNNPPPKSRRNTPPNVQVPRRRGRPRKKM